MNRRPCKALNFDSTAKCRYRWVCNNYSNIKEIASLQKNNSPLPSSMWKKEATSYYYFFIKFPWPNGQGPEIQLRRYKDSQLAWLLVENQLKIPIDSSAIITPFTILIMVSRRTLAELDVADPLENTWRWKEAYRHLRCPLKVSGVVNFTYFQTLIKFDSLQSQGGSTVLVNLIMDYITYFPIRMTTPQMKRNNPFRTTDQAWRANPRVPGLWPAVYNSVPQLFQLRSMNYEAIHR